MKPFHLIMFCLNSVLQPVGTGLDVFQSRPKLAAWQDRVKQAVGENLFAETHDLIMKSSKVSQTLEPEKAQMFRPIMMRYFQWVALQQEGRAARLSEKLQVLPPNCAKIHKDEDYTSPGQTTGSKTKMFVSGNHQKARLTCFVTILSCWCSIISTQNIKMKTNHEKKKWCPLLNFLSTLNDFRPFSPALFRSTCISNPSLVMSHCDHISGLARIEKGPSCHVFCLTWARKKNTKFWKLALCDVTRGTA